jgi:hypothetical protein
VLNTPGLHRRPYSDYEMRTSVELDKRIVVVQPPGAFGQPVPTVLDGHVYRYASWRSDVVARAVRGEYPYDNRTFDLAEVADRRTVVTVLSAGVAVASLVVIAKAADGIQRLKDELAGAGVQMQWSAPAGPSTAKYAAGGALIAGAIVAAATGDLRSTLLAAGAGGLAGAAVAAHRTYHAHLLGSAELRVLAVEAV